jgi:hypothetical protein
MQKFIMNLPTMKELELTLFQQLQAMFAEALVRCLEELDNWIMEHRDRSRFRLHELRHVSMSTSFGEITFARRLYRDRKKRTYVYLLDQSLSFDGQSGISPRLEEWAVELATVGPSYHEAARQIEALLGYQAISHETIRQRLMAKAEQAAAVTPKEKKKADVLFVEVDGLFTKLQRTRRRSKENRMAVIHEGWERTGNRVKLRNKTHYLHQRSGDTFWEGFGDFLVDHYEVDEETWLVVNGDGAEWIGECTSYFHRCIYTLDRFHVARDLKHYLRDLPTHWKAACRALAAYDPQGLLAAVDAVPSDRIREDWREDWERFKTFLHRHQSHLIDYREVLEARGIDTKGMRPMGSAESQMRVFAKRTKRGGYSWSERGVQAMLRSIIARKEGHSFFTTDEAIETSDKKPAAPFRLQQLFKKQKEVIAGVTNGMLRTLQTSRQSSPLGMALKGLRG